MVTSHDSFYFSLAQPGSVINGFIFLSCEKNKARPFPTDLFPKINDFIIGDTPLARKKGSNRDCPLYRQSCRSKSRILLEVAQWFLPYMLIQQNPYQIEYMDFSSSDRKLKIDFFIIFHNYK
jgi:hypothetical protein